MTIGDWHESNPFWFWNGHCNCKYETWCSLDSSDFSLSNGVCGNEGFGVENWAGKADALSSTANEVYIFLSRLCSLCAWCTMYDLSRFCRMFVSTGRLYWGQIKLWSTTNRILLLRFHSSNILILKPWVGRIWVSVWNCSWYWWIWKGMGNFYGMCCTLKRVWTFVGESKMLRWKEVWEMPQRCRGKKMFSRRERKFWTTCMLLESTTMSYEWVTFSVYFQLRAPFLLDEWVYLVLKW